MKSRKDISKRYHTKLIINIIVAAIITCLTGGLLIFNMGRLMGFITGNFQIHTDEAYTYSPAGVFLFLIAGIVLFCCVFWFLQRNETKYINMISDAMKRVAGGDLDTKVEIKGDDEFSGMAENLNKMTGEIKELLKRERESEQSKNDLITNIAHDLKTPLTSIIGYLELLSGKNKVKLTPELEKKYLDIAYGKSRRLEQLIEDLFNFTKLSYGKITMKVSYVDIVKLLEQLLEEQYPAFAERGLSYELRTNVKSLEITADGNLLARLFDNLIGNAIKYGAEGKRVIVKINAQPQTVEVKVINYGYIIPETDQPLIFNKFYRVDQSRSTNTGGTGLGLAIAKDIAEMHSGSISVQSDLNGTVFTVRLKRHFNKNNENFVRA